MREWLRHAPAAALLTLATLAAPVLLELAAPPAAADLVLRDAPVVLPAPPPVPPAEPPASALTPLLDPAPVTAAATTPAPVVAARLDAPGPPTLAFTAPGLVSADFTAAEVPSLAPGPLIFDLAQVDVPPRPLAQPAPAYPSGASLRRIEGEVVVEFDIGVDGRVEDARVISAKPEGWFEAAALAAVRQWRFVAAQSGGRDVRVRARQKLTFTL